MNFKLFFAALCLSIFTLVGQGAFVQAQNLDGNSAEQPAPSVSVEQPAPNNDARVQETFAVQKPLFNPAEYKSILYTSWEQDAIALARRAFNKGEGYNRGASELEIQKSQRRQDLTEKIKPPPEEREIRLAGILYDNGDRWTIWLNEERVTPDAVPPEVIDLTVHKEYIEFKWIDDYTNRIYPIRLRPHQRFNIDTRIFLPG